MRADLDLLCISVYCTADDLLPARPGNGRRKLSDAEIVTLCVAQALMGIPSDRRFLRANGVGVGDPKTKPGLEGPVDGPLGRGQSMPSQATWTARAPSSSAWMAVQVSGQMMTSSPET